MIMNLNSEKIIKNNWECFKCELVHPNTLRYCPCCDIAKVHSDNLRNTSNNKNRKN